mmetsp:Transcript_21003/g.59612  ORF Transcript_21003/g.59612 Transcript_21003/m.59612 type:complete len:256 (-) Transcript_21003:141-908(-)
MSAWTFFRSSIAISTFLVSWFTFSSIFFIFLSAAASRSCSPSRRSCDCFAFRVALSLANAICSTRISSIPSSNSALALSNIFSISFMISLLSNKDSLLISVFAFLSASARACSKASSRNFSVSLVFGSNLGMIVGVPPKSLLRSSIISVSVLSASSEAMSLYSSASDSIEASGRSAMSLRFNSCIARAKASSCFFLRSGNGGMSPSISLSSSNCRKASSMPLDGGSSSFFAAKRCVLIVLAELTRAEGDTIIRRG